MRLRKLLAPWMGIIPLVSVLLAVQVSCLPCDPVYFPDPNLERAVRYTLWGISGDICSYFLLLPLNLNAHSAGISDLSGLENWSALTGLYLEDNLISDISPLAALKNLTYYLHFSSNQVSDISPLAGLTKLTELGFGSNQVSDIAPVTGLVNLEWLSFNSNQVTDISVLTELINLHVLDLGSNQIEDISPLAGLTELETLFISNNQVSDLSPLAGLTKLTTLDLSDNQITDILALADNTGIDVGDKVHLQGNPLDTESCTAYVPELESRGVTVYHDCL